MRRKLNAPISALILTLGLSLLAAAEPLNSDVAIIRTGELGHIGEVEFQMMNRIESKLRGSVKSLRSGFFWSTHFPEWDCAAAQPPVWIEENSQDEEIDVIITFFFLPGFFAPGGTCFLNFLKHLNRFLDNGNLLLFYGQVIREETLPLEVGFGPPRNFTAADFTITAFGDKFLPSLRQELNMMELFGSQDFQKTPLLKDSVSLPWEVEVTFRETGNNSTDLVVLRNKRTNGRIAFFYLDIQASFEFRPAVISEFLLNWLPTATTVTAVQPKGKLVAAWGRLKYLE